MDRSTGLSAPQVGVHENSALEIDSSAARAVRAAPAAPVDAPVQGTTEEDKDLQSMRGYRQPAWKLWCFVVLAVLTAGLSLLACHWFPRLRIWLTLSPCPLADAQYVVIKLTDGRTDVERVTRLITSSTSNAGPGLRSSSTSSGSAPHNNNQHAKDIEDGRQNLLDWQTAVRHTLLEHRCTRFLYSECAGRFIAVPDVPQGFVQQLHNSAVQLAAPAGGSAAWPLQAPDWDLAERSVQYGSNEMRIPVKSLPALIFAEMWHPFYCFQYASIAIWIFGDQYYSYSVCIAVITWFSIITSALEAHSNMRRLARIALFDRECLVWRDGRFATLSSTQLVPGDVIAVQPGTMPCDAVLLSGRECIVDENMLTGESVPVRKVLYSPVADGLQYTPDKNPSCTLYGGTHVAQARAARGSRVLALVVRTRFYSAKGQLLRSILHPREHQQSFVSDSLKFICVMLLGCMALYIWAAVVLASIGADAERIAIRALDMITIAVPPALPACLTIATVFSIRRLRKHGVFVTGPDRITMAGQLDVCCFDKTGTLTEQGLELQGIVPVSDGGFQPISATVPKLPDLLQQLLASCHGLSLLDGALVGDPLDQRLFEATGWELIDAEEGAEEDAEEEEAPTGTLQEGAQEGLEGGRASVGTRPSPGGRKPHLDLVPEGAGLKGLGLSVPLAPLAAPPLGSGSDAAADEAWRRQQHLSAQAHTCVRPPGAPASRAWSIVRRFEFRAELQRSMVLVRGPHPCHGTTAFAKGSPEAIRGLVDPASVPPDFDDVLAVHTREGLRVLALAAGYEADEPATSEANGGGGDGSSTGDAGAGSADEAREAELGPLSAAAASTSAAPHGRQLLQCSQEEVERRVRLSLVGLAVMVNPLRPDSAQVIRKLQAAAIRTVMVTGDHVHTAISVAHLCGITPLGKPVLLVDGARPGGHGAASASVQQLAEQSAAARAATTPSWRQGQHEVERSHAPDAAEPGGGIEGDSEAEPSARALPIGLDPVAAEMHLQVLHPGGTVDEVQTATEVSSAAMAVMAGELACAVTGKGFARLLDTRDPALLLACLQHASVYARMAPDQKRDLMGLLGDGLEWIDCCPHLGLHVGFCGDGANDCGALKASHVGVSLCEAEASVAAPMTSKQQSIAAMLTVVGEGRCTLMATFQIFQFIIGYALVQAFETNLMYTYALNIGNYQYLIQDLFFTTVLAALMGYTAPRKELAGEKPPVRVMTVPLMTSTVLQLVVVVVFQLMALYTLSRQPDYVATIGPPDLRQAQAPENTVTYVVALAQFIILAVIFNKGMPHRSPLFTNVGLLLALLAQAGWVVYTLYSDDRFNVEVQEMVDKSVLPNRMRSLILILVCMNALAALLMASLSSRCVEMVRWFWPPTTKQGLRYTAPKQTGEAAQPLATTPRSA